MSRARVELSRMSSTASTTPSSFSFTPPRGMNKPKSSEEEEEIVSLNVGGQPFVTTTTTLRNDPKSMLFAMFSGKYPSKKDFNGAYFIDRDGKYFRCILLSRSAIRFLVQ